MTRDEARAELERRLRSGDYQQGESCLKAVHPDTGETLHCCLGVGGEITVEEGLCEWVAYEGEITDTVLEDLTSVGYEVMALRPLDGSRAAHDVMPTVVMDFFGFRGADGGYSSSELSLSSEPSLAKDNDFGASFDTIADTIAAEESLWRD